MEKELLGKRDNNRIAEMDKVRSMRSLIASTSAVIVLLKGADSHSAIRTKDRVFTFLKENPRIETIRKAQEVDDLCQALKDDFQRSSSESKFAFELRRLNFLSIILKSNITEGDEASLVTDLLMGISRFDVTGLRIIGTVKDRDKVILTVNP